VNGGTRCQINAALPRDNCAFGHWFGIVFGEADPPFDGTRCFQRGRVCESECAD
jgi:hypothetical protein